MGKYNYLLFHIGQLLIGLVALLKYPRTVLFAGWEIYWKRRTNYQLDVVNKVSDEVIDLLQFKNFEIPIHSKPWDIPLNDLYWLTMLVDIEKPKNIMELGTFTGLTTLYLAKYSSDNSIVTTIDLSDDDFIKIRPSDDIEIGMRYKGTIYQKKIKRVALNLENMNTENFETQDFIFIDAMHLYEDVKRDTNNALQLLNPGGMIVWHDYNVDVSGAGVVRYLNELSKTLKNIVQIKGTNLAFYKKYE